MVAKRYKRSSRSGQSVIEFAVFIPLYFGLIYFLIRGSMALNSGIVYQQYARLRLFELMFHHRDYPVLRMLKKKPSSNEMAGWQRFWIGVDNRSWADPTDDQGMKAPIVYVGMGRLQQSNQEVASQSESTEFPDSNPNGKTKVRVRVLSFICLGPKILPGQGSQVSSFLNDSNVTDTLFTGDHFRFCDESDDD